LKRATNSNNNLLIKQAGRICHSEKQLHYALTIDNMTKQTSEWKIKLARPEAKQSENLVQPGYTKLFIKNMVSIRCKLVVKAVLENLGLNYSTVELGEVKITGSLSHAKQEELRHGLLAFGLELLDDRKSIIVEKLKNVIVEMIHYADELPSIKFSHYISKKLNYDYTYLANLFSEVKGMSIQHFMITHKIERVKELMIYDELSLTDIAWQLHYSSVAHLSAQFKKITGLSPTHFKNMKQMRLTALDDL
jgi:AraC-like DNA-binding protein